MKRILMTFAAGLFASGTAFAYHCPADMKKIDDALAQGPELSAEQLAEITALRAEGEMLHDSGKHQESVDTLAEALQILGIE